MKKQYVLSALIALAFTLGMSTGEARAKRDLAQGKTVKEKNHHKRMMMKKKMKEMKERKKPSHNH